MGHLPFHNYKTSDRLLTRFENDNIAFKDEEIELQTELSKLKLAVIPCNPHQQKSKNSSSCGKLSIRKSNVMKNVLAGHLRLLEEQLKTAHRELDETSMRISELGGDSKRVKNQQLRILNQLIQDESAQLVEKESKLEELEANYKKAVEDVSAEQAKFHPCSLIEKPLSNVNYLSTSEESTKQCEVLKAEIVK